MENIGVMGVEIRNGINNEKLHHQKIFFMEMECRVALRGFVKKSAMLSEVETHSSLMLWSLTASLTKKKFLSKLFICPFDALLSDTRTAARLSHLRIRFGSMSRDFTIGMRKRRKSIDDPIEINSAAHVEVATTFCRREPHAMGLPRNVIMKPDVERWYSPPQLASDQVIRWSSVHSSFNRMSFVVAKYWTKCFSPFQWVLSGFELKRAR